jgi:hypothetical protein
MSKAYRYVGISDYQFNNPPDPRCTSCRYFTECNNTDYKYQCTGSTGSKAALLGQDKPSKEQCGEYEKKDVDSGNMEFRGKNKALNMSFGMLSNGCKLCCGQGGLCNPPYSLETICCGTMKIFVGFIIPIFVLMFYMFKYMIIGIIKLVKLISKAKKEKSDAVVSDSSNDSVNKDETSND